MNKVILMSLLLSTFSTFSTFAQTTTRSINCSFDQGDQKTTIDMSFSIDQKSLNEGPEVSVGVLSQHLDDVSYDAKYSLSVDLFNDEFYIVIDDLDDNGNHVGVTSKILVRIEDLKKGRDFSIDRFGYIKNRDGEYDFPNKPKKSWNADESPMPYQLSCIHDLSLDDLQALKSTL